MPDPASILGISRLPQPGGPVLADSGPLQPRTAVEQALTEIWQQVLPAPAIGPEADFFSLGGDSLLAVQVVVRARQVFGVTLEVAQLLDHPTIGGLAAQVELAWRGGAAQPAPAGWSPPASQPAAPMVPVSRAGPLPLSFIQERMWFIQQLNPSSAAYNIARTAHLRGPLDQPALAAAFTELARRHETLRTTFAVVDGEPRQCPQPPTPFSLPVIAAASLAEAYALAGQAAHQPFDLARGPLLRVSLYHLGDQDHLLLLCLHHIIADAWSLGVLARELSVLYRPARLMVHQAQRASLPEPAAAPPKPLMVMREHSPANLSEHSPANLSEHPPANLPERPATALERSAAMPETSATMNQAPATPPKPSATTHKPSAVMPDKSTVMPDPPAAAPKLPAALNELSAALPKLSEAMNELPIQYADFAAWQRTVLQGQALSDELAYWLPKLQGVPALELPLDHPRPATQTFLGAIETAGLDPHVLRGLQRLARQAGATLSMVLLAAFQVLLARYTGQDDIAVGVPIANRRDAAVEGLIGAFVNTLVLRTRLAGALNFRELLARVRQDSLEAYAHPDLPFARLVAELNPGRDLSHGPLVQVMFNHINVPMPSANLAGLEGDYAALDRGAAQFDLTLTVLDRPLPQRLRLEYSTDLFEAATARRLLSHYTHLLAAIAADPAQPLASLPLLDESEQRQLLVEWNDTARPYPAAGAYPVAGLAELFEQQAARTPASPALIVGNETLSYDALNRQANQTAHLLRSLGVGPGGRVGLCAERSFEQLAALLGVLKAGAAYVPLDPAYPPERLRHMLADSGAAVVLAHLAYLPSVMPDAALASAGGDADGAPDGPSLIALDTLADRLRGQSDANLGLRGQPDDPAYLIYTSGSTGRPKGVAAPQRSAVNRAQWMWDAYPFQAGEVACHKTSLNFVDSVAEIFVPLLRGVPLVLIPDDVARDPARLVDSLARQGVTRLVLVPSLLRALLALPGQLGAALPRLALVTSSGERLDGALARACAGALPGARLLNLYGSSEDGGDVCAFDCGQLDRGGQVDRRDQVDRRGPIQRGGEPLPEDAVPIGRPIANSQIYVLDPAGQPAPIGVVGEIYVGGAGLALGYHNQPGLNAERFVPHPFSSQPGARLFRTGDLGRWLPDGNLLYQGRRDRQVKVRGVRIEPDEVQEVLALHPQVAACAVRAHRRAGDDAAELAAYSVARPGARLTTAELRRHLARRLPESMLPAWFVWLDALPLLPNGKVDLAALPDPDPADYRRHTGQRVAPRTLLETRLAELWAESLGRPDVGVRDNFFELGGHSLLAVSLFARIRAALGPDLPLALLFQAPTIEELAAAMTQAGQALAPLSSLAPLKPSGSRPPLFCVHPLGGGVGDYAALAQHLHPQQPFYGLRAKGLEDDSRQSLTVEALAADYLAEIRAVQPSGPYRLAGYSSGGLIAFEMARQLAAAGEPVALLAMLDSYAPSAPPAPGRPRLPRLRRGALRNMAVNLPYWMSDLARLEPEQIMTRLRHWRLAARHGRAALTAADYLGAGALARLPERHRRFVENHFRAIARYAPEPYAGRVTLFRAQAQALSRAADPDKGWGALALGGLDIREFPGSHHTLLREPWVAGLAAVMQTKLDEIGDGRLA